MAKKHTTLSELERLAKKQSKEIVESGEQHNPIMLMITPKGVVVALIEITPESKDVFKKAITQLLRECEATGYVFITEGWKTAMPGGAKKVMAEGISVSSLPPDDRDEIISILSVTRGKTAKMFTAIIDNTPTGRRLRDFGPPEVGYPEGRMVILDW